MVLIHSPNGEQRLLFARIERSQVAPHHIECTKPVGLKPIDTPNHSMVLLQVHVYNQVTLPVIGKEKSLLQIPLSTLIERLTVSIRWQTMPQRETHHASADCNFVTIDVIRDQSLSCLLQKRKKNRALASPITTRDSILKPLNAHTMNTGTPRSAMKVLQRKVWCPPKAGSSPLPRTWRSLFKQLRVQRRKGRIHEWCRHNRGTLQTRVTREEVAAAFTGALAWGLLWVC